MRMRACSEPAVCDMLLCDVGCNFRSFTVSPTLLKRGLPIPPYRTRCNLGSHGEGACVCAFEKYVRERAGLFDPGSSSGPPFHSCPQKSDKGIGHLVRSPVAITDALQGNKKKVTGLQWSDPARVVRLRTVPSAVHSALCGRRWTFLKPMLFPTWIERYSCRRGT